MSGGFAHALLAGLTVIVITTFVHALLVIFVVAWRRLSRRHFEADLRPVTWFRPLKADVGDLKSKLSSFLRSSVAEGDQVLFGVDAGSEAAEVAADLARDFPDIVQVIECRPGAARNPKASKLLQMAPSARHESWIIADAEALFDPAFATAFRREWHQSQADVLTAGYRFTGTGNWPQQLDAMSTVLTLWPGLELVRMFGTVRFTLGACTALRRSDLEAIGGWASLGDELAEDYWLGARLGRSGKTVRLSEAMITLEADAMSWRDYWRHQLRVAATYRAARPIGTAGMILTRGVTAGLLASVVNPLPGFILFSLALATRVALAECMASIRGFPLKSSPVGLVIISDAVETLAWLRAWFARSIWWGGRARRISWRGRLRS